MRKFILPLALILTIPLGELYRFWHSPHVQNRQWFLLTDLQQDLEWYIKDSSEALIWLIFIAVWIFREFDRNRFWVWLLGLFFVFRLTDLCAYWVNHRHAGLVYFFCYLSIILYATGYFVKNKHKQTTNEKGS